MNITKDAAFEDAIVDALVTVGGYTAGTQTKRACPIGELLGRKEDRVVRLNNGTRAIEEPAERERFIAQRWGRG